MLTIGWLRLLTVLLGAFGLLTICGIALLVYCLYTTPDPPEPR